MNSRRIPILSERQLKDMLLAANDWALSARVGEPQTSVVAMKKLMDVMVSLSFNADLRHVLAPIDAQMERVYAELAAQSQGILRSDDLSDVPKPKEGDPFVVNSHMFLVQSYYPFARELEQEVFYQTELENTINEMYLGIEQEKRLVVVLAYDRARHISEDELYFEGDCVYLAEDITYALLGPTRDTTVLSTDKYILESKRYGIIVQKGKANKALVYPR